MKHTNVLRCTFLTLALVGAIFSIEAQSCLNLELITEDGSCGSNLGGAAYFLNEKGEIATADDYDFSWSAEYLKGAASANDLDGGSYSVTVTEGNCSEIFHFSIFRPRKITWAIKHYLSYECPYTGGAITIQVFDASSSEQIEDFTVQWLDPNISGSKVKNLAPGTYHYYIVVDNCMYPITTFIQQVPAVTATLSYTDNVIDVPGEVITVNSVVSGGEAPYTYSWQDPYTWQEISTQPTLQTTDPGCYALFVTDNRGCTTPFQEVCIQSSLSIRAVRGQSANNQLFPNPAQDRVFVPLPKGEHTISLYNLQGTLLLQQMSQSHAATNFELSLNSLANGTYVLISQSIKSQLQTKHKVVVQR